MEEVTYLFLDWHHIEKGRIKVSLNKNRLRDDKTEVNMFLGHEFTENYDFDNKGYKRIFIPYGISIELEKARLSETWLYPDIDKDENLINHMTVIRDAGKYRCWYYTNYNYDDSELNIRDIKRIPNIGMLAYCESKDGYNWKRPMLDEYLRNGEKTNIVSEWFSCGAVFKDRDLIETGMYKSFNLNQSENGTTSLMYVKSDDGYHWEPINQKLIEGYRDTPNIITWDITNRSYLAYLRDNKYGRCIARSSSKDFIKWSEPEVILKPDPIDEPDLDYYTNGFTYYPDNKEIMLLFCSIFHHGSDNMDVRLAVSRDNHLFNWISYDPVISVDDVINRFGGCIYTNPNLVYLPDGDLALPCNWTNYNHEEPYMHELYSDYRKALTGSCWAIWEDGRLAGIRAKNIGEFYTKEFLFNGKKILINAKTFGAGCIRAEIIDCGKTADGYTVNDGMRFSGDKKWVEYNWNNDLQKFCGHNIRIRFILEHAKIYGFKVI